MTALADILVTALGGQRFSWGSQSLSESSEARNTYLSALKLADAALDYGPLIAFARS